MVLEQDFGLSVVEGQEAREVSTTDSGDDICCDRILEHNGGKDTSRYSDQNKRSRFLLDGLGRFEKVWIVFRIEVGTWVGGDEVNDDLFTVDGAQRNHRIVVKIIDKLFLCGCQTNIPIIVLIKISEPDLVDS
jgi:hypothetical protein